MRAVKTLFSSKVCFAPDSGTNAGPLDKPGSRRLQTRMVYNVATVRGDAFDRTAASSNTRTIDHRGRTPNACAASTDRSGVSKIVVVPNTTWIGFWDVG